MRNKALGWDYPPGAENHPDAPWNQPDYEDACIDYQVEKFQERLEDEPDVWISEGITQQCDAKMQELYHLVIKNLKRGHRIPEDNMVLGKWVRELVETYATPSDDEAYEAVTSGE